MSRCCYIKTKNETICRNQSQIRKMMLELTPAVEPISLDEAFLDLTGTERLHKKPPAVLLAELTSRLKNELGLTGSVGLSHNKFLAKVASTLISQAGFP